MAIETLIEERLANVERAVCDLQRVLAKRPVDPNWVNKMTGIIDDPAFEEVVKYGRDCRLSDLPDEDEMT